MNVNNEAITIQVTAFLFLVSQNSNANGIKDFMIPLTGAFECECYDVRSLVSLHFNFN